MEAGGSTPARGSGDSVTIRALGLTADARLPRQEFTSREFRDAVGAFASGVTVITTRGADYAHGMTASAFSSASLDPPLVLACIAHTADAIDLIEQSGVFAVNILAADQRELSNRFASKERPKGPDAFRDIGHRKLATGCPILDGAVGYVDCALHASFDAGDHRIFIGEVLALGVDREAPPLCFQGGSYASIQPA